MVNINDLIDKALLGVIQLKEKKNLRYYDLLPDLENKLVEFKANQNEDTFYRLMQLFQSTLPSLEGESSFNSTIRNASVSIGGCSVIFDHLMDDIFDMWEEIQKQG